MWRRHLLPLSVLVLALAVVSMAGCGLLNTDATDEETDSAAAGRELYDQGEFEEAIELLTDAVDDEPEDLESRRVLALALAATGDIEGAIAQYGEVVAAEPDDHVTMYRLGILERQIGDAQAAEEHLAAAAEANPTDPSYWDELARTRLQLGMELEAAEALQSLLDETEIDTATRKDILVMQGEAYVSAGTYPAAIASYEAAVALDPSDVNIQERLDVLRGDDS